MNVTLELEPEVEAWVLIQANVHRLPLEAYLQTVIAQIAAPVRQSTTTLEEFEAAMDELAQGSENLPILPSEAFTRESIYGDH